MSLNYRWRANAERPVYAVDWRNSSDAIIDFSSGYTFTLKLVDSRGVAALTKTTNITGASTSPNVVASWATGELNVTPGTYTISLVATHATSGDHPFAQGDEDTATILPAL